MSSLQGLNTNLCGLAGGLPNSNLQSSAQPAQAGAVPQQPGATQFADISAGANPAGGQDFGFNAGFLTDPQSITSQDAASSLGAAAEIMGELLERLFQSVIEPQQPAGLGV